jgi:hypothetical protein
VLFGIKKMGDIMVKRYLIISMLLCMAATAPMVGAAVASSSSADREAKRSGAASAAPITHVTGATTNYEYLSSAAQGAYSTAAKVVGPVARFMWKPLLYAQAPTVPAPAAAQAKASEGDFIDKFQTRMGNLASCVGETGWDWLGRPVVKNFSRPGVALVTTRAIMNKSPLFEDVVLKGIHAGAWLGDQGLNPILARLYAMKNRVTNNAGKAALAYAALSALCARSDKNIRWNYSEQAASDGHLGAIMSHIPVVANSALSPVRTVFRAGRALTIANVVARGRSALQAMRNWASVHIMGNEPVAPADPYWLPPAPSRYTPPAATIPATLAATPVFPVVPTGPVPEPDNSAVRDERSLSYAGGEEGDGEGDDAPRPETPEHKDEAAR